jgi:hypothetical protein
MDWRSPIEKPRSIQEARTVSARNQSNIIVSVYHIESCDGTDFIATEYVLGKTRLSRLQWLDHRIRSGRSSGALRWKNPRTRSALNRSRPSTGTTFEVPGIDRALGGCQNQAQSKWIRVVARLRWGWVESLPAQKCWPTVRSDSATPGWPALPQSRRIQWEFSYAKRTTRFTGSGVDAWSSSSGPALFRAVELVSGPTHLGLLCNGNGIVHENGRRANPRRRRIEGIYCRKTQ